MRLVIKAALAFTAITIVGVLTTPHHTIVATAGAVPVPEPSSIALFASALGFALLFFKPRKQN